MKALAFGEILWDVYGDRKTLGGAPLNVLGHLSRLGASCSAVSAVGDDELGHEALERLDRFRISRRFVRISPYPTGRADVILMDGKPSYAFNDPSAWDDIRLDDDMLSALLPQRWSAVIFGTLAARHEVSAGTLKRILEGIDADEVFFDVNLRLSFYSKEILSYGFSHSTIVKMSDEELPVIAAFEGVSPDALPSAIISHYGVKRVIVTLGKNGSVCFTGGKAVHHEAGMARAIDTVGAGDSFSAAFLHTILSGGSTEEAMHRASILASYVVSHEGALPEYDDELRKLLGL